MSRLTNDRGDDQQCLVRESDAVVSGMLGLVGAALVMLWINPKLALISLTVQPLIMLGVSRWLGERIRSGFRQQQVTLGVLNGLDRGDGDRPARGQSLRARGYGHGRVPGRQWPIASAATRAQISPASWGRSPTSSTTSGWRLWRGGRLAGGDGPWRPWAKWPRFINYSRQFGRPLNEIANLYNASRGDRRRRARLCAPWTKPRNARSARRAGR
jgi:ATP-binding cassette subfamily B multidrug efflux pump